MISVRDDELFQPAALVAKLVGRMTPSEPARPLRFAFSTNASPTMPTNDDLVADFAYSWINGDYCSIQDFYCMLHYLNREDIANIEPITY